MRPVLARPFPDEHEILLLQAALARPDQAADAWRRWRQAGGAPERADAAATRLLPLVYRNFSSWGAEQADMTVLRAAHRRSWSANQRLFHAVAPVIRALGEAGIETMALKGAALAISYYADAGARSMDDFDLLVHLRDGRRAIGVLRDRGWMVDSPVPLEGLLATRHAVSLRAGGQELDLHWRALYQTSDDERFWLRSIPMSVHRETTRALCPEDQLIHVCVHGLGLDPGPLRWIADALMVIRGRELDWGLVVDEARRRKATVAVGAALGLLAGRFSARIPGWAVELLAGSRPAVGERLAYRAATSTRRGRGFVVEWRRHRELRQLDPGLTARSFLVHLQYMWGVSNRRQVFARLARKALQVARYGYSHPRGERRLLGR